MLGGLFSPPFFLKIKHYKNQLETFFLIFAIKWNPCSDNKLNTNWFPQGKFI